MPFTPSHAIVALPFVRSPLIPAAIAVGAMAPDLPLFVRLAVPGYGYTHNLRWIPATMLLALALLLVWRFLLRPAARALSPLWLARRLPENWGGGALATLRETFPSFTGVLWLALSLAMGVASHIAWDAFTHEGRMGSALFPILHEQWGRWHLYRWLQYGSSALGIAVLAIVAAVWFRSRRSHQTPVQVLPLLVRVNWWLSLPAILVIAWAWGIEQFGPLGSPITVQQLAYRVLPPACAIWAVLTLALCVATPFLVRRMSSRPRNEPH